MPLNCYQKVLAARLHCLYHSVLRHSREAKPPAGVLQGLVVRAPHADARGVHDAGERRPFKDLDMMKDLFPFGRRAVLDRPWDLKRYVLEDAAAERHVRELCSVAYGEYRLLRPFFPLLKLFFLTS